MSPLTQPSKGTELLMTRKLHCNRETYSCRGLKARPRDLCSFLSFQWPRQMSAPLWSPQNSCPGRELAHNPIWYCMTESLSHIIGFQVAQMVKPKRAADKQMGTGNREDLVQRGSELCAWEEKMEGFQAQWAKEMASELRRQRTLWCLPSNSDLT